MSWDHMYVIRHAINVIRFGREVDAARIRPGAMLRFEDNHGRTRTGVYRAPAVETGSGGAVRFLVATQVAPGGSFGHDQWTHVDPWKHAVHQRGRRARIIRR